MYTPSNRHTTQTASALWPPEMTGKRKKNNNLNPNRIKSKGRKWTKGRRKEKPAGRKRHAETDRRRQQDKKPHHLLLYLLDLISGVNNIGQKYKMKKKNTRQKRKKKTKGKKQWVNLQHKNTVQSMRLAQKMGVGAVTRLTNGSCVPLYWLQHTSCNALCPTTAAYSYYNLSYDLQRNHLSIPSFHGFACITGHEGRKSQPISCPP